MKHQKTPREKATHGRMAMQAKKKVTKLTSEKTDSAGSLKGYIFLMSVLLVGALALMATLSLLLLSWSDEQAGVRQMRTAQALELARSCMDVAALKIRTVPGYAGGETVTLSTGTCQILTIQGSGASQRTICTKGTSGNVEKMMLSVLNQLYPQVKVSAYREPTSIKECGGIAGLTP